MAGFDLFAVSINPSNRQVRPGYFATFLRSVLRETGLDPGRLAVELHEEAMADPEVVNVVLGELSDLGVGLWLDDFGTGLSPLLYLKHYPFSVLKVDRRYILEMDSDPKLALLATGIVGLGRHLGLATIAEGVVSEAQVAVLREHGCDMGQGWHYHRPLPAAEVTALLQVQGRSR